MSNIVLILAGHFLGALLIYLNHRFVFHTKLGNLPFLRMAKKLHAMHHAHAYDEERNAFIFIPWQIQIILANIIIVLGFFISWWFAAGVLSFALLYSYRHYSIHNHDNESKFFKHHDIHHKNIKYNFSGIYPFIDYIFGTAK